MKNITVRISDVQHRKARVWAAEHGTSLSAMVEHLLQNLPVVARAVRAILASELEAKGIPPSDEAQALIGIIKGRAPTLNKTRCFSPVQLCNTTQPAQPENVDSTNTTPHRNGETV
jgi:plasmid stability protein